MNAPGLRQVLLTGLLWGLLALTGCTSLPEPVALELAPLRADETDAFAAPPAPAPVSESHWAVAAEHRGHAPAETALATGQLLVWANRQAVGLFVGLFADEFLPWTHIGVVSVEPDGVWIYDTNAALMALPGVPLTDTYSGGMRRIRYRDYVRSDRVFGLYAPPADVNVAQMLGFVRGHFQRATRFDAYFNSADPSELYCSELVALAYEAGGGAKPRPAPVRANRSYEVVRRWLKIPAHGFYLPGHLVAPERQLAMWSSAWSPAQALAFFEVQVELVRRLKAETRLGQLMRWDPLSRSLIDALSLRSAPQRFLDASLLAVAPDTRRAPDPAAIQREVRRVADLHFARPQ